MGIKALVFMTTDPESFVFHLPENPQARMREQQISALEQKGWVFGAHGASHLPATDMELDAFSEDLESSINWVEKATGKRPGLWIPGNTHQYFLGCNRLGLRG